MKYRTLDILEYVIFQKQPSVLLRLCVKGCHLMVYVWQAWFTQHMYLLFYWLAMANSCVNPIVYYWMNKR